MLRALNKNEASALLDFTKIFQQGLSAKENLFVFSLKRAIHDRLKHLFPLNFECDDDWNKYRKLDKDAKIITFYPSKLKSHFKLQYKFLDIMSNTQLFM